VAKVTVPTRAHATELLLMKQPSAFHVIHAVLDHFPRYVCNFIQFI
jgi:hypothetical protein